jgi:hypothetical protein
VGTQLGVPSLSGIPYCPQFLEMDLRGSPCGTGWVLTHTTSSIQFRWAKTPCFSLAISMRIISLSWNTSKKVTYYSHTWDLLFYYRSYIFKSNTCSFIWIHFFTNRNCIPMHLYYEQCTYVKHNTWHKIKANSNPVEGP